MSLIQQNFYGLVMKSKFNSLLYKFFTENQDIILGTDNADTLAIMYESYRIGVGLLSLEASESCVQTYIDYIYKEYADYPKTIIAIVWVLLSAHKESHQYLRSTIRSLSNELKDYKSFHLWKRFCLPSMQWQCIRNLKIQYIIRLLSAKQKQPKNLCSKPNRLLS